MNYSSAASHSNGVRVRSAVLFISNISVLLTAEKVLQLFSFYGSITSVRTNQKQDGLVVGYCFLQYSQLLEAEAAIHCLNGLLQYGRQLRVQWKDSPVTAVDGSTLEVFFTFKSQQINHFVYESTMTSLIANFTSCPVVDVAFKTYKIVPVSANYFGTGYIHFPRTIEGAAAVQAVVRAFSTIPSVDGVYYDARVGYGAAARLRSRPTSPSNETNISVGEAQCESISGGTTPPATTSTSSVPVRTALTTENMPQQLRGLPYARFRDVVHLIPEPIATVASTGALDSTGGAWQQQPHYSHGVWRYFNNNTNTSPYTSVVVPLHPPPPPLPPPPPQGVPRLLYAASVAAAAPCHNPTGCHTVSCIQPVPGVTTHAHQQHAQNAVGARGASGCGQQSGGGGTVYPNRRYRGANSSGSHHRRAMDKPPQPKQEEEKEAKPEGAMG